MDPYERLANAIVLRAVEDYRMTEDRWELRQLEGFFLSGWFSTLTNADGSVILKKLREEKAV